MLIVLINVQGSGPPTNSINPCLAAQLYASECWFN